MKWYAFFGICATLYVYTCATSAGNYFGFSYRKSVDFGSEYALNFVNESAHDLIKKSPFNFLNKYELENLRHIVQQKTLEELEEIQKKKLFRIGVMRKAFDALYDHEYSCRFNVKNITLSFTTEKKNVTVPDKWILSFFNVTQKKLEY